MWSFTKKQTLAEAGFFQGFTDWHCHILPGVDDGVQTMDEALQILAKYEELGIKEVWLTPHIMEDMPNTTGHLRERFAELQAAYKGNVRLHLAAENMLDNLFGERLEANDLLPLGKGRNHLLVETSYYNPPMGLLDILQCIKAKGYHPVLAHPERYMYMKESDYARLKGMGVKLQLNLLSLIGAYGAEARKISVWMLKHDFYGLTGSDIHNLTNFEKMIRQRQIPENELRMLQNIPATRFPG